MFELIFNEQFLQTDWAANETQDILDLAFTVMAFSFFTITAGLFPAFPYAFSLLEERNCGYLRYQLSRMSANQYIYKKLLFVGISGATAMGVPYVLLMCIIGRAGVLSSEELHPSIMEDMIWGDILLVGGGWLVLILKGILIVMFGILWAQVGLLVSLFVKNRYLAFVLPFVIYQFCWLAAPADGSLRIWNPVYMITSDFMSTEETLQQPFIIFTCYIMIVCVLVFTVFKRQVKHGY
ncbi:MAG: hypothetical protein ACI4EK_02530 [Wujia sp.]